MKKLSEMTNKELAEYTLDVVGSLWNEKQKDWAAEVIRRLPEPAPEKPLTFVDLEEGEFFDMPSSDWEQGIWYMRTDEGCVDENGVCLLPEATEPVRRIPSPIPRWISVKERLPEEGERVLVWVDGRLSSGVATGFAPFADDVTHWMPSPAGPKEVRDENP